MARADLLKKLFQSFKNRDDRAFTDAAMEVVDEERRKHHVVIANELDRILKNGVTVLRGSHELTAFDPPPRDSDRHVPLLEVRQPNRYLSDLVLNETQMGLIRRIMVEFREWEVLEANGLTPMQRVLFCGPSGCGKTATAEAVASELGLPLLYVRFDSVVSSLLGETAANLRKVFDYASRGQWVVMFDEFDAIGRSRDDVTEHGEIKRVVNSFLQIMDGFAGRSLVISATNFEASLDPAVWRRFDDVLRFEKPTPDQVRSLLERRLNPLRVGVGAVERMAIGVANGTFADAERVCLDIRKDCAIRGAKSVSDQVIDAALVRHAYRRDVLRRIDASGTPEVDKE